MREMQILDLLQGSDEWLTARMEYLCASEAPAMMGCSKYMSRNQLLDLKKGWMNNPDSSFKQKLFQKGHESEAAARDLLEVETCEDYPPIVGLRSVDGLELLASFDGLEDGGPGNQSWEHKEWNQVLSANVRNGVLEDLHYWQLEHHCIVNGFDTVLFCCSDGGSTNKVTMVYQSTEERRQKIIAGWKQFVIDLETHEIKAKQEAVVAVKAEALPAVTFEVEGSMIVSNISLVLPEIKKRAEIEMNRDLETDQDFADKDSLNKATKAAREKLKDVVANVKGEFVSFSEFADTAAQIDEVLQKMQAQGEKQVKQAKDKKKQDIKENGEAELDYYVGKQEKRILPLNFFKCASHIKLPDFMAAMKGKRTIDSLKSVVDGAVAKAKIEIDQVMARIVPNQIYLKEHGTDYHFLFADVVQIINQETESFQAIVKSRIADHKEAEAVKVSEKMKREQEEKVEPVAAEVVEPVKNDTPGSSSAVSQAYEQPDETSKSQVAEIIEEPAPKTFMEDMTEWQERFGISQGAVDHLGIILKRHGV